MRHLNKIHLVEYEMSESFVAMIFMSFSRRKCYYIK